MTGIYPGRDFTEDELLEYAAYAESYSNHPISKSLKISYGKELERPTSVMWKKSADTALLPK